METYCIELKIKRDNRGESWDVNLIIDKYYLDFLYILDYVEKDSDFDYWVVLESDTMENALLAGISKIRDRIKDN